MIEQHMPPPRGRVVLHWPTGTAAEARRAVDLGCYFSVNAEMLINEKRAAITKTLPLIVLYRNRRSIYTDRWPAHQTE